MLFKVRDEKAFTLFEVLFILLITSIIVPIAFPLLGGTAVNARLRNCQANLRTIDGAINQYHAENGAYPSVINALVASAFLRASPECPHAKLKDYSLSNQHDRGVCSQGHEIP